MKNGKIWGLTNLLVKNDNFEVHRIEINPYSYCSVHKHQYKHNIFYVESGMIEIKVWKNDYDLCDKTVLKQGEMIDVKPGEFHQFESYEYDAIVYEIYYSEPISGDIVRKSCGGIKKKK